MSGSAFTGLIFEPHGAYGSEIDGETMPFGYISTGTPLPVFELAPPLVWPVEDLTALALKMAAAPELFSVAEALATTSLTDEGAIYEIKQAAKAALSRASGQGE